MNFFTVVYVLFFSLLDTLKPFHYLPWLIMKIIINLGREILLLGSVRESIMTPSETNSEKIVYYTPR
jgi:hypothetical protein